MAKISKKDQVLLFLATNGATRKTVLGLPFINKTPQAFSKVYRRLLTDGLVKETRFSGVYWVELSKAGISYVRQKFPNRDINYRAAQGDVVKQKRKDSLAFCRSVLVGAGIILSGNAKPSLLDLISNDDSIRIPAEKKFRQGITNGFFYQTNEITPLAKLVNEGDDVFFGSRLLGIVITEKDVFFVYVIRNYLIRIICANESRLVRMAGTSLAAIPVLKRYTRQLMGEPPCIVIGIPKGNLPKIFFGNAHGNLSEEEKMSTIALNRVKRWKDTHATYQCLSAIYSKVFFVTGSAAGLRSLTLLREVGSSGLIGYTGELVREFGYSCIGDCLELCWNPRTGQLYVLLPYIEMGELLRYKQYLLRNNGAATVIAPLYYKDIISRCLGPAVLGFIDIDSREEQRVFHYDKIGLPVEANPMENLRHFNEKYFE